MSVPINGDRDVSPDPENRDVPPQFRTPDNSMNHHLEEGLIEAFALFDTFMR